MVCVKRKAWFVDCKITGSGGELERKNGVEIVLAGGGVEPHMYGSERYQ